MEPTGNQNKEQVVMNSENIEVKHEQVKEKKGRGKLILVSVVLVLIIIAAGVGGFFLSESRKATAPVATNTTNSTNLVSPGPVSVKGSQKTPKNYVYVDGNENIVVGDLKTGKDTVVVKAAVVSKYWSPIDVQISPNGKYLTYLSIPKEAVDNWEANPPVEIHGYGNLGVHLVDISDLSNPKDIVVANDSTNGPSPHSGNYWLPDSSGFYYVKSTADAQTFPLYNIKNKTLTSNSKIPEYLESFATISPNGKEYVAAKGSGKKSENALGQYFNLGLYSLNGSLKKMLLKDFQTSGYDQKSMIFADPQTIFMTREVFGGGPDSICYIDQVNVNSASIANIEEKDCPPGFSNTNYSKLKISPDGKYLSANYNEDGPSDFHSGSIFLYDLKTGVKKLVGEQESIYRNYYWISNDEIVGLISGSSTNDQNPIPKALIINVKTGEVSDYSQLNGKAIISLY